MNNVLYLTSDIPPSINNDYMKPRAIMKYGKPMTIMYESKVAKDYKKSFKAYLKREILKQGFIRKEKYTVIEWTFYFARVNQDTNNYYKCLVDSITESGEIWEDDNLSLMRDVDIFYDSKNPRVELKVYYLDKIGVFKNKEELGKFVELNCSKCIRGNKLGQKGGCSIYKRMIENRIQEDIDLIKMACAKIKIKE